MSDVLFKTACPECRARGGDRSGNNLGVYPDHAYCYSCEHWVGRRDLESITGMAPEAYEGSEEDRETTPRGDLRKGTLRALPARHITEETVRRYGYISGPGWQAAPYRDSAGRIAAQKLRFADKDRGFPWEGSSKGVQLWGQHLAGSGSFLAVTEGEIDAMSISQVLGNKWPVVSVINGSAGAKRDLLAQAEWLKGFHKVVLCFDQDEPGRKATEECARALAPIVAVHVAQLPVKDANEMLKAEREEELANAVMRAARYKPAGLLRASQVRKTIDKLQSSGHDWPFRRLTELTYGRREGEIFTLGAGVGVGKTDVMAACQAFDVTQLGLKTAIFSSEQSPEQVLLAMACKVAGRRFNVPDAEWSPEQKEAALDRLEQDDRLVIYDRAQDFSWDTLRENIRYLAAGEGFRSFYLDNLTATMAHAADERRALDALMEELAGICVEYGLLFHAVSHLTTPEGRAHEEGGRVLEKHFTGSRAIARWSNFMLGLERDKQAEDPEERHTSTLRVLKDRNTGKATGETLLLQYDDRTGLMHEKQPRLFDADADPAF